MNTQASAMPEVSAQVAAPHPVTGMRRFYWSVVRELWENRSIYLVPMGTAAAFFFFFLATVPRLPAGVRALDPLDSARQQAFYVRPYAIVELMTMGVALVVAIVFCLDALYGERRDRSVLFWKSLPVSDFTTVLAKASIPLVALPLVTWAVTVAVQVLMFVVSAGVLAAAGLGVAPLWTSVSFFSTWTTLLLHFFLIHGLWYGPFYGWLLLVSAWARRAPIVWAIVPGFAVAAIEQLLFGTSWFALAVRNRFWRLPGKGAAMQSDTNVAAMLHVDAGHMLASPAFWTGLLLTAAFLYAAARLRRWRDPM